MNALEGALVVVLLGLATHRATRLLTRDALPLIAAPRRWFTDRWSIYDSAPPGVTIDPKVSVTGKRTNVAMRSLAYLWECDWCMSVWVSGILTLITVHVATVPLPWLAWAAASTIAALIAERESD